MVRLGSRLVQGRNQFTADGEGLIVALHTAPSCWHYLSGVLSRMFNSLSSMVIGGSATAFCASSAFLNTAKATPETGEGPDGELSVGTG